MVGRPKRATSRARRQVSGAAWHVRHFLFLRGTAMSPPMKMHRWSIAAFALTSSAALAQPTGSAATAQPRASVPVAPQPSGAVRTRQPATGAYLDPNLSPLRRAADLVGRMTLEEKVLQMQSTAPAIERLGV